MSTINHSVTLAITGTGPTLDELEAFLKAARRAGAAGSTVPSISATYGQLDREERHGEIEVLWSEQPGKGTVYRGGGYDPRESASGPPQ